MGFWEWAVEERDVLVREVHVRRKHSSGHSEMAFGVLGWCMCREQMGKAWRVWFRDLGDWMAGVGAVAREYLRHAMEKVGVNKATQV